MGVTHPQNLFVRWPGSFRAHEVRSTVMRPSGEFAWTKCGLQVSAKRIIGPSPDMPVCKNCRKAN